MGSRKTYSLFARFKVLRASRRCHLECCVYDR